VIGVNRRRAARAAQHDATRAAKLAGGRIPSASAPMITGSWWPLSRPAFGTVRLPARQRGATCAAADATKVALRQTSWYTTTTRMTCRLIAFTVAFLLALAAPALGADTLPPGDDLNWHLPAPTWRLADAELDRSFSLLPPGPELAPHATERTPDGHAGGRDWGGLGRDAAFLFGYELIGTGVVLLLPEVVTGLSLQEKGAIGKDWLHNVQNPHWDKDRWPVNYIGHPYFGAVYYIRARERGFDPFSSFFFSVLMSGMYEFGVEALFERPSYNDMIVTPVAGSLIGAFVFEPLRDHIRRKTERRWWDHVALTVTDPLGVANSFFEGLFGIKSEARLDLGPSMARTGRSGAGRGTGLSLRLQFAWH
jgi:hypothetical protein